MQPAQTMFAYFGGGCFWCTEAIFERVRGVVKVTSGYAGGSTDNPNYFLVVEELTGHAEVIQVEYDPAVVSYPQLLDIFFHTHDPTSLNQQGADKGTKYRSIILFTSSEQQIAAEKMKKTLSDSNEFSKPLVTEIKPLTKFYPAESYHQNYYQQNENTPYCQVVISPKLAAFHRRYAKLVK